MKIVRLVLAAALAVIYVLYHLKLERERRP